MPDVVPVQNGYIRDRSATLNVDRQYGEWGIPSGQGAFRAWSPDRRFPAASYVEICTMLRALDTGPADPVRCGGPMIQFASTACTRAFNPSAARRAWHGGAPARAALVGSTPRFEHHPWVRTCIDLLQPQCDRVAVDANPAHVPRPGSSARSHCDAVQIGTTN